MLEYKGREVKIVGKQDPFGTKVEFLEFPGTTLIVDTHVLMGTKFPMPMLGVRAAVNEDFRCRYCDFMGSNGRSQICHERQQHDPAYAGGLRCPECGYSAPNPWSLESHRGRHHGVGSGKGRTDAWWRNSVVDR